jgi:nucleotide-binding universal stress UspA family protein
MKVVAAVDGSGHTTSVVKAATEFAAGGEIHFLYVSGSFIYPYMVPAGPPVDFGEIRKSQTEAVWKIVGRLPENSITVTLEGEPASTIVDYAKNVDADLIAIGSRGRNALASLLLGSVSHGVVHAADRNVLIVRS